MINVEVHAVHCRMANNSISVKQYSGITYGNKNATLDLLALYEYSSSSTFNSPTGRAVTFPFYRYVSPVKSRGGLLCTPLLRTQVLP